MCKLNVGSHSRKPTLINLTVELKFSLTVLTDFNQLFTNKLFKMFSLDVMQKT